jgi:catechol 2,3-dioxygenase-like lactoylglutathione lyase family enzyme
MSLTPMLFVDDVEASSRWYQSLLGLRSAHGGPEFEMLQDADGSFALYLHRAEADEHGEARRPAGAPVGSGVLFYRMVEDVRAAHRKASEMGAAVEGPPTFLPQARQTEFVVRDPDGYAIAVAQSGDV